MVSFLKKNLPALFLLALGVGFLLAGIYREEVEAVYTKAAAICLECIGIG